MSLETLNLTRGNGTLHLINKDLEMNMQALVRMDFMEYPSKEWTAVKNFATPPLV
jgi:hypothetical protein